MFYKIFGHLASPFFITAFHEDKNFNLCFGDWWIVITAQNHKWGTFRYFNKNGENYT